MTNVLDGMAVLTALMLKESPCEYKPRKDNWTANLEGSGEALAKQLGNKPNAINEASLSSTSWPSQAHHLIPHLTLKPHPVAKWLKAGDNLFADTNYDVDHKKNGKWMPYASSLPEWKTGATKKADVESNRTLMFKVMRLAKIQMHQGKHSGSNKYGIGEAPYKERVKQYLKKIKNNAVSHYTGDNPCGDCKGNKNAGKYPPRRNTVNYVDKASDCIEKDIEACKIFVSRIAAEFAEAGGFGPLP